MIIIAKRQQRGRNVEGQRFGRRGLDLSKEGRRNENLRVDIEDVRNQSVRELLSALAGLDIRRGLAQSEEDFEFANRLTSLIG